MNDESMELLRAARPSGQDDADPAMAAARSALAGDAALTAELAAERLSDAAFAHALQSAEIPENLPHRLIAAMRAGRTVAEPPAGTEVRTAVPPVAEPRHVSRARRTASYGDS